QELPLANGLQGFVGGQLSYVGDRLGQFVDVPPAQRQVYPAYTQVNLHTGLKYDSWTANLYINNATDRRGAIAGGAGSGFNNYLVYIQPRTIGITLARRF